MEGEAIGSAAKAFGSHARRLRVSPRPRVQLGASPRGSVHGEGSEIEGCGEARLRESSVAAHDSCGDPGGEGSRDNAAAESSESAVKSKSEGAGVY